MRSPSDCVFTVPTIDEVKPYSVEKDVKTTKPMTKTIIGISVSMKRIHLLLRLFLAMEKMAVAVIGKRRGRINVNMKETEIDSPTAMRKDSVSTI